ncbi:MAG TPA: hypothetical protein VKL99_07725, partial [Candidatus Angelobacter sp.]|nr:hypothetical protein [Candidatus Angelobacter sp.]
EMQKKVFCVQKNRQPTAKCLVVFLELLQGDYRFIAPLSCARNNGPSVEGPLEFMMKNIF